MFVMLGTPHYPQSGIGTLIRLDTTKDIRTRKPMDYITPYVDIRQEAGSAHLVVPADRSIYLQAPALLSGEVNKQI